MWLPCLGMFPGWLLDHRVSCVSIYCDPICWVFCCPVLLCSVMPDDCFVLCCVLCVVLPRIAGSVVGYCCCRCAAGSCGFCAVCGIDTCFWGVVKQHVVTMCLCSAPQDTLPCLSRMLCKLMVLLHEVRLAAHRVFLIHSIPHPQASPLTPRLC